MAGDQEYYDIVLLGRVEQGVTTLARKLLNLENTDPVSIRVFHDSGEQTKKCELTSNEVTKVRVIDVPGFSGSDSTPQQGTLETNVQIIQTLGRMLDEFQPKVRRIVYFLPVRGPYEKADGSTQEELKLLSHYFGREVFDCLVVAATNPPREKYQEVGFSDFKQTTRAFHAALKSAVGEDIACPPIVYIGLKDSPEETLHNIQHALVLNESTAPLRIKAVGPLYPEEVAITELIETSPFEDDFVEIEAGGVHPSFVDKYTPVQKFVGGCAHVALLGVPLAVSYVAGWDMWPGFTNSDMMCEKCHSPPDAQECKPDNEQ